MGKKVRMYRIKMRAEAKDHKQDDKLLADQAAYAAGMDPNSAKIATAKMVGDLGKDAADVVGDFTKGKGGKAPGGPPDPGPPAGGFMGIPMPAIILVVVGFVLFLFMKK